jgi:hypothetical protein
MPNTLNATTENSILSSKLFSVIDKELCIRTDKVPPSQPGGIS